MELMLPLYVTVSEPSVIDHKNEVNSPKDEPGLDELVFQSQYPGPGSFPYLLCSIVYPPKQIQVLVWEPNVVALTLVCSQSAGHVNYQDLIV